MRQSGLPASHGQPRGGVSVLDLLLVAAALLLLVTEVLPWAGHEMVWLRADRAADTVAQTMTEARRLAVERGEPVRLLIDPSEPSVEIQGADFHRLAPSIRLSGPPPGPQGLGVIVFRPDGGSDGGQVVVATANVAWSITVDRRSGRPRRVRAGSP